MAIVIKELVAKLDESGSETSRSLHFTFGKAGNSIGGGLYIPKGTPVPDKLIIYFATDPVETVLEEKGEE